MEFTVRILIGQYIYVYVLFWPLFLNLLTAALCIIDKKLCTNSLFLVKIWHFTWLAAILNL